MSAGVNHGFYMYFTALFKNMAVISSRLLSRGGQNSELTENTPDFPKEICRAWYSYIGANLQE